MTFKLGFIFELLQIMNHNSIEYNISNHKNFKRHGYKITCKPIYGLFVKNNSTSGIVATPPPVSLLEEILLDALLTMCASCEFFFPKGGMTVFAAKPMLLGTSDRRSTTGKG